jgi:hypothetical protein
MPEIDKETELKHLGYRKFIRVGNVIHYSEDPMAIHDKIAVEFGVVDARLVKDRLKHYVDDAGLMKINEGKLMFDESTSSTLIRGDMHEARKRTIQLGKDIFGADKVSDTYAL